MVRQDLFIDADDDEDFGDAITPSETWAVFVGGILTLMFTMAILGIGIGLIVKFAIYMFGTLVS